MRTAVVTPAALSLAALRVDRRELAAVDAVQLAEAALSTARQLSASFAIHSVSERFGHLVDADFRTSVTPIGVTVMSRTSAACLQLPRSGQLVRIVLGPCS